MNKYQVILSNNEMLRILADGVNRDGTYLWFYEHVLDAEGKPKTTNDAGDLEVIKVAEFSSWHGWNYIGVYEEQPKVTGDAKLPPTVGLTAADIARELQEAVKRQAQVDPQQVPPGFDPYKGRS